MGSEEFIRLQFEEYLLALLSCMNYREHMVPSSPVANQESRSRGHDIEGDPALEFNPDFLAHWATTPNYALYKRLTDDALLFSIVEPRHPSAGALNIEDIQRRLAQQVAELHLDERVREGREALNKTLATSQKRVSSAFNSFWADIEALREAQRKRNEEKAAAERVIEEKELGNAPTESPPRPSSSVNTWFGNRRAPSVDLSQAQASVSTAGQKAGAYISSWGSWASERRKEWQDRRVVQSTNSTSSPPPVQSSVTSASTTTLPNVSEKLELDRGRRESLPRRSEDSAGIGRSGSRRKRWSSVLRKKDRSDSESPYRTDGLDVSNEQIPPPKSPLSQTAFETPPASSGENALSEPKSIGELDGKGAAEVADVKTSAEGLGTKKNSEADTSEADNQSK
jgi:hypothetical protein